MKVKPLKTIIKIFINERRKKRFDSITLDQVNEILQMKAGVKENES